MKKFKLLSALIILLAVLLFIGGCGGGEEGDPDKTTITYWQYTFPSKVEEIDKLIEKFEKENPDIEVIAQDFPHDQYQQKIFAAMEADKGPDIMNIYYGWVPEYVDKEYIQPIREEFMSKEEIEDYYVDTIQPNETDGKFYDLPIAVRSLALFYNKDLFKEAGLDPESPPATWDELVEYAKKMTVMDSNGRFEQEGYGWNVGGQDLHMFQQVMLRQWGVEPYSEDAKEVLWNSSPEGLEAFHYWIDMTKKHKIGDQSFLNSYSEAFIAGKAGMIIDGSFRIGDVQNAAQFDWGITTLPVREEGGLESNYASYWTNAISSEVSGEKLEASEKFLAFLISEDVQKEWLENVGELPAAEAVAGDEEIKNDPVYGPFAQGLEHAHATFFVNEEKERDIMMNKIDEILLEDKDEEQVFNEMIEEIQQIRDEYFED